MWNIPKVEHYAASQNLTNSWMPPRSNGMVSNLGKDVMNAAPRRPRLMPAPAPIAEFESLPSSPQACPRYSHDFGSDRDACLGYDAGHGQILRCGYKVLREHDISLSNNVSSLHGDLFVVKFSVILLSNK